MQLRRWRFAALTLTAVGMGTAFCHLLELPAKMRYDASTYAMLQRTLYRYFGPVGGVAEFGAVVATLVLTWHVRRHSAFPLTAAAASALVATELIFLGLVVPAGVRMMAWSPDAVPADWTRWRDQWEYAHAARAALMMGALGALTVSVLRETPEEPRGQQLR